MANIIYSADGDGHRRHPIDSNATGASPSPPLDSQIIGQDAALHLARGAFGRTFYATQPSEPISLVGPVGSGKSSIVRELAGKANRPLVEIDMAEIAAHNEHPHNAAVRLMRERVGSDPKSIESGVVYVKRILGEEQGAALLQRLLRTAPFVFGERGNRYELHPNHMVWVLGFTRNDEDQTDALSQTLLGSTRCRLSTVIPLRKLDPMDLYAILTASALSPLHPVRERLARAGVESFELSENAAWDLVHKAVARYDTLGAHGLQRVIDPIELEVWARFLDSKEQTPCKSR